MRALVVYESLFGNTRRVAEAIARGLGPQFDTEASSVVAASPYDLGSLDLLLVGGPTHAFGLSSPASRREAEEWTHDPNKHLVLEPGSLHTGVREWLRDLPDQSTRFVAFDTREDHSVFLTGAAAKRISKILASKGLREAAPIRSFLVEHSIMKDERLDEAEAWGEELALVAKDERAKTS